ncbi:helix-turn-helix domain-containing protein [Streptomyces sp. LS1784]|uniref:helix-turn-helix domain-containing protein n=1 Tax=Streptomyces sp. LS1784 TaxID=2851533 RepID=UPI001CCB68D5|nr:helix-turn-helix transcriptional regulator [Streptomyces sp. LS1784]
MPAPYQPDDQQIRDRRDVGARILSLRRQADLTQEKLGERAGLDRRTIGRLENGLVPATLDQLGAIARAIGVPLWRLFREK